MTNLFNAQTEQEIECLLQDKDIRLLLEEERSGRTPLMNACEHGNYEVIEALLKNGVNVNNGIRGHYPLYIAVLKNDLKMFNILIAANADVNIGFLTFYGHIIHYVCSIGYCDIFDRMIKLNCDLEITGFFDETPLITACMSEQIDIVDRLLALDCNVNACDENGKNAFLHSVETGNLDIINKLIVYGADITHIDNDGKNALYYANLNGSQKIIDYISSFNCF